jgi:AAA15 family ATPase/GTPase
VFIHGDIGMPRLVPIPFMGDGVKRVLSIVLAIASASGGVVLIDEIENGLHYSVQKQVWQAIAEAARRLDVQVFATTHSWECLAKAHEAFAEDEVYDFRWHRLQEVRGEIQVVSHDREMIEAALYNGVEIR